ncbi:MAG: hypothetical protein U9Q04_05965 [Campylobacterota bacterium]|nr:hypothetical protein [Campylobacterota bacterium]
MKKIIITSLIIATTAFGDFTLNSKLEKFELLDQFDKTHMISKETKKLIFAYKKDTGHLVKDFLSTKESNYLSSKSAYYIADVSAMPSFIRWFALDALDDYNYPILLIEDDEISAKYKDEKNIDKIVVLTLDNLEIKNIQYTQDLKTLQDILENK